MGETSEHGEQSISWEQSINHSFFVFRGPLGDDTLRAPEFHSPEGQATYEVSMTPELQKSKWETYLASHT